MLLLFSVVTSKENSPEPAMRVCAMGQTILCWELSGGHQRLTGTMMQKMNNDCSDSFLGVTSIMKLRGLQ